MLIYIHKEQQLDDVEKRYPARHYVLAGDNVHLDRGEEALGAARDDGLSASVRIRAVIDAGNDGR